MIPKGGVNSHEKEPDILMKNAPGKSKKNMSKILYFKFNYLSNL